MFTVTVKFVNGAIEHFDSDDSFEIGEEIQSSVFGSGFVTDILEW